jgi:hypothetical protein
VLNGLAAFRKYWTLRASHVTLLLPLSVSLWGWLITTTSQIQRRPQDHGLNTRFEVVFPSQAHVAGCGRTSGWPSPHMMLWRTYDRQGTLQERPSKPKSLRHMYHTSRKASNRTSPLLCPWRRDLQPELQTVVAADLAAVHTIHRTSVLRLLDPGCQTHQRSMHQL